MIVALRYSSQYEAHIHDKYCYHEIPHSLIPSLPLAAFFRSRGKGPVRFSTAAKKRAARRPGYEATLHYSYRQWIFTLAHSLKLLQA